jgi:EthD domain
MTDRPTPGAKMMYLIKRRPGVTREELVMHWFANHMPAVIKSQHDAAAAGRMHAHRYIAALFDPDASGVHPWDGVAQLWWDKPLPKPKTPIGTAPRDSFQQKAEPYVGWATTEYVVMDGSDRLPVEPLTLNAPFPCTRSGFFKVTFLVKTKPGIVYRELFDHWLGVHAPNVRRVMGEVGGFRYVVSHSIEPASEPYAGMAELYFPDAATWARFSAASKPDGIERWLDTDGILLLTAGTEMIGIP